jgi:hypothetical protein
VRAGDILMAKRVNVYIDDVGGSFARFIKNAPKEAKEQLAHAVRVSAVGVAQRMRANVAVGPDAPHLKDDVDVTQRGMSARIGFFGGGSDASDQPHIALYNEFTPNTQPFMRPAAEDESSEFRSRAIKALRAAERNLSVGRLV